MLTAFGLAAALIALLSIALIRDTGLGCALASGEERDDRGDCGDCDMAC